MPDAEGPPTLPPVRTSAPEPDGVIVTPIGPVTIYHSETPTLGKLFEALAKAQGLITAAEKSTKNTHLNTKYADLNSVREACVEPLSTSGLCIIQRLGVAGTKAAVTTILGHSSGEWMRDTLEVVVEPIVSQKGARQPWIQAFGTIVTYLRRYAWSAMVGVASAEDDDGAGAAAANEADRGSQGDGKNALERAREQAQTLAKKNPAMLWFGNKDHVGKPISGLDSNLLTSLKEIGEKAVAEQSAKPEGQRASWLADVQGNLKVIDEEIEKRIDAAMKKQKDAPREPGSDNGDEPRPF